jgi:hypothetical protein
MSPLVAGCPAQVASGTTARRSGCFLARGFGVAVGFRTRAIFVGGSAGCGDCSWSAVTGIFGAGRVPAFARPVEVLSGADVLFFFSSDISMANHILSGDVTRRTSIVQPWIRLERAEFPAVPARGKFGDDPEHRRIKLVVRRSLESSFGRANSACGTCAQITIKSNT